MKSVIKDGTSASFAAHITVLEQEVQFASFAFAYSGDKSSDDMMNEKSCDIIYLFKKIQDTLYFI